MDPAATQRNEPDGAQQAVQAFYDAHPYPSPLEELAGYRRCWPEQPYRADLRVLVAGCGTSQAAKHALRQPESKVVGIDLSARACATQRRCEVALFRLWRVFRLFAQYVHAAWPTSYLLHRRRGKRKRRQWNRRWLIPRRASLS